MSSTTSLTERLQSLEVRHPNFYDLTGLNCMKDIQLGPTLRKLAGRSSSSTEGEQGPSSPTSRAGPSSVIWFHGFR